MVKVKSICDKREEKTHVNSDNPDALRGSQRQNNWVSYSVMRFLTRSQLDKWTVEVLTHWNNLSFHEGRESNGSPNARTILHSYSVFRVIVPLTIHYHFMKSEQQCWEQLIVLRAHIYTQNIQLIWCMTAWPNLWHWWLKSLTRLQMMALDLRCQGVNTLATH